MGGGGHLVLPLPLHPRTAAPVGLVQFLNWCGFFAIFISMGIAFHSSSTRPHLGYGSRPSVPLPPPPPNSMNVGFNMVVQCTTMYKLYS
jgi:hypothetical protein